MDKFEEAKLNMDAYGKNNFFEYLEYMMVPTVYGTEYDILLQCEFLKVSIDFFSSSSISFQLVTWTAPLHYLLERCLLLKSLCGMKMNTMNHCILCNNFIT